MKSYRIVSLMFLCLSLSACKVSESVSDEFYRQELDELLKNTAASYIVANSVGGETGLLVKERMQSVREEIDGAIGRLAVVRQPDEGILVVLPSDSVFRSGQAQLKSSCMPLVDALCQILGEHPQLKTYVLVHTDNNGSDYMALTLSEHRAKSLKKAFRQRGLKKIHAEGKGTLVPVITNESEAGRRQNRRVEMAIVANRKMVRQARKEVKGSLTGGSENATY